MSGRKAHTSALPALSSTFALRLLEAKPNDIDGDWYVTLPKVVDKPIRLARDINEDAVEKLLKKHITLSAVERQLSANITTLCRLFSLSYPAGELLTFVLLLSLNEGIEKLYGDIEMMVQRLTQHRVLCQIFNCNIDNLRKAQMRLFELGFIDNIHVENITALVLPDFLSDALLNDTLETKEQLLAPLIYESPSAQFKVKDFSHINTDLVLNYFSSAIKNKHLGTSLLLYGDSGNGKTEFARTLAAYNKRKLIEVRATRAPQRKNVAELGHRFASDERLQYMKLLQVLLDSKSNTMLLVDECESLFDQADTRYSKERLQRLIEDTAVPCIWITNHVDWLEPSYIRRFKLVVEVTAPPASELGSIIDAASKGLRLSKLFKQHWAKSENLSPALINNACHVAKMVGHSSNKAQSTVTEVVQSTFGASGLMISIPQYQGEMAFDDSLLNIKGAKSRIRDIEAAVKHAAPIRILLTGPSGTGKTAYVHHLAEQFDKSIIRVSASDVLSKYVGESEQQVAELFHRAHQEQAILLFDEVDSLLANRHQLTAQHDVQLVNELLTQIECNTQPVFAATNFADKLDHAVLRRFDIKLECTYLSAQQSYKLFKQTLGIQRLTQSECKSLSQLQQLTPGDFAIVARHKRFNSKADYRQKALSLLIDENRRKQRKPAIGFLAN